jgi:hypothetical protein
MLWKLSVPAGYMHCYDSLLRERVVQEKRVLKHKSAWKDQSSHDDDDDDEEEESCDATKAKNTKHHLRAML